MPDSTMISLETVVALLQAALPASAGPTQATLEQVLAKLSDDPATASAQAQVLAKLSNDPATDTTLAAAKALLDAAIHVGSSALEKSHVIKATPGTLRSVKALNTSGATLYLHVFDLTALPANGTAPDRTPIPIAAGDVNGDSWPGGTTMAIGCVAALSSTIATLTLASTSCGWFDAEVL